MRVEVHIRQSSSLGEKYQVVIPASIRKQVNLKLDQKVVISVQDGRIIIEPLGRYKIVD
jgi:AbrB family looped-hinge helix DNA binding protein